MAQGLCGGDFAVFRLTPDKYHYNHTPVAGIVADIYEIAGGYHSCNPGAVVEIVTPYSKNKRVVTIIDTDVPDGTGVGLVAMVEVVALMIGEIVQCYSTERYDNPQPVTKGMFLAKGRPKSLYRPGSSTDVLIFQQGQSQLCGRPGPQHAQRQRGKPFFLRLRQAAHRDGHQGPLAGGYCGGKLNGGIMTNLSFMLFVLRRSAAYLYWGIRTLPRERWQILAAVPVRKKDGEWWDGVNLTWYGLLTGNAYVVAVAALFILMGAVNVPLAGTASMATVMLACCVPASRLVARVVEKKAHTFTVGGAVFVGVIIAPAVVFLVNRTLGETLIFSISPAAALAAFAIAYAFGEGLGRLACISFGCCYGKQLASAPPWQRRLSLGRSFIFTGRTRKIAYAGGMEGMKVIPVQALTAIIYCCIALISTALFLQASYALSFVLALAATQLWRVFSETLRADYRGAGTFSAYQVMGLISILYGMAVILLGPDGINRSPRNIQKD